MRQEARLPLWLTPPESLLNEPVLGRRLDHEQGGEADDAVCDAGGGAIDGNGGTM